MINRRDLLRLCGDFLLSQAFDDDSPGPAPGDPPCDGESDFWEEPGREEMRAFVRLRKTARYTGPALIPGPPIGSNIVDLQDVHDLHVMTPSRFSGLDIPRWLPNDLIREHLGPNLKADWHRQRGFVESTVGMFAETGRPASYDFGSVSFNGAWRSGRDRREEDRRLKVSRRVINVEYLDPECPVAYLGAMGDLPLAGICWGYKRGPEWEDADKVKRLPIARITVLREMDEPVKQDHVEYIYCRAIREADHATLHEGRSPGEADIHKHRTDGLRTTPILGLHKAHGLELCGANALYSSLDIELDPINGRTLSVRATQASYGSSLARMPVEHRALRNAVNGKSTPCPHR